MVRSRRSFVGGVTATFVALTAVVSLTVTGSAAAAGPIKWGAEVRATGTQTTLQAVQALQTKVGRTLAATRDFLLWDSPFPTAYENGLKAQGTTILLSVGDYRINRSTIRWSDIAAAQPGSTIYTDITSWADRIRDFGAPIYVTMQHEPEAASNTGLGTASEYIAAWQKWVSIFRAQRATNVKYLWITTAFAYKVAPTDRRQAIKWYPGDAWVDGIGADAYNWYHCPGFNNPWNSLASLLSGHRTFVQSHPGKEVWVPECSVVDPASASHRAQWFTDAKALFKTAPYVRYVGVLYFDINGRCDTRIDTDAPAVAAFKAMGHDAYYAG